MILTCCFQQFGISVLGSKLPWLSKFIKVNVVLRKAFFNRDNNYKLFTWNEEEPTTRNLQSVTIFRLLHEHERGFLNESLSENASSQRLFYAYEKTHSNGKPLKEKFISICFTRKFGFLKQRLANTSLTQKECYLLLVKSSGKKPQGV